MYHDSAKACLAYKTVSAGLPTICCTNLQRIRTIFTIQKRQFQSFSETSQLISNKNTVFLSTYQTKFLLQRCQSISWDVSYLSFHKIVSAVQGIFLPIGVLRRLCSFQLCFCFSQAQCTAFQDSFSAKFSSSPQSTTCPRSIFLKAFIFGALINLHHDSWLWYTSLNSSFLEICSTL